nr:MAG TPA: hypothetical protein [Caudoviricetes sp.]
MGDETMIDYTKYRMNQLIRAEKFTTALRP